jgi:hypothetical protein
MPRAAAQTQKWLAFRALNGALDTPQKSNPMAHVGLAAMAGGVVALCAVNDAPFIASASLQVMTHAVFCITAACMYALYKIVKHMLSLVLAYAEDGRSPYRRCRISERPKLVAVSDAIDDNNDDENAIIFIDEKEKKNVADIEDDEDDEVPDPDSWTESHEERIEGVPREVVVSNMYLGGVGAFLSIAPLCMWDPPCTLAFCIALLCIATCSERTHWLSGSVASTLLCAAWVESTKKQTNPDGPAPWPHIIVAAASPFLIRSSAGTLLHHRLSPSQTLEMSLPVAVVLAILVLCWYVSLYFYSCCVSSNLNHRYSPLEETLLAPTLSSTATRAMILVPPYIAATLALMINAFRTRNIATVAAVLSAILVVRQACLTLTVASFKQDWRTAPECVAIASALVGIALAATRALKPAAI